MEQASKDAVVRSWLRRELDKRGEQVDVSALDEREALERLVEYKPDASQIVSRRQSDHWHLTELDRETFTALEVISGPPWTAFSPDNTVIGAARRILEEDIKTLDEETIIDIPMIAEWADSLPNPELMGHLILFSHSKEGPVRVIDGNHRAIAKALHVLRTDDYRRQPVYLGTPYQYGSD